MMTDNQKKLAAIITAKIQEATADLRCEIEKELDEQTRDEDSVMTIESFYVMDDRLDKLAKAYGFAIAKRSNAVTTDNLIDGLTGTSS